jgi:CRP-like cAMP-binding protein
MSNELDVLRSVSILRDLNDDEMAALRELITVREILPKARIVEEGAPVGHFYIVFSGVVHVRRLAQKREMLMGRLGPGGFFGEINLFDPGLATASIYAMKPTQVGAIAYEDFRNFMSANPQTGFKIVSAMMTEMSRRLRQTSARLVHSVYWSSAAAGEG